MKDFGTYLEKNFKTICISFIPMMMYSLVMTGLMIKGYIPVYAWDKQMTFGTKVIWELVISFPAIGWFVSIILDYLSTKKEA